LFEQFGVVGKQVHHDSLQGLVVFNAGVLLVRIAHGVLVGFVGSHLHRDFLADDLADFVGVFPLDIAELVIERLDDVAQAIQLRLGFAAAAAGGNRLDFRILVGAKW
jgi:hypothetical protein